MTSKIIAIDLDEVLACFVSAISCYHNDKYNTNFELKDYFSYRYSEVWGGDDEQATEKVHDFFKTKYFKEVEVVKGAQEGIAALRAHGYKLVIVTSRQLEIQDETKEWLGRHFPADSFDQVMFGNHWGLEGQKVSKKDLCKQAGACAFIDDSLAYVSEVANEGLYSLLFDLDGSYPWNKTDKIIKGVTRVTSWNDIVDKITTRISK